GVVGLGQLGGSLAAALAAAGLPAGAHVVIDDDESALEQALDVEGVVAIVADVGGSAGDSVRRVLARITAARLVLNERMRALLEARYARRDRPLPRAAERLALLPRGAVVAESEEPMWSLESEKTTWVVFLRGAAAAGIDGLLLPLAQARLAARGAVAVRTFKTAGVSAEDVEDRLVDRLGARDVTLTTLPGDGEVWVRLRARGRTHAAAVKRLAEVEGTVADLLGDDCYGRDVDSLEAVVGRLLKEKGLWLSVAESCTGGLVGHRITSVAGSSAYFERGVMVYTNTAKEAMLGVDEAILRAHGAVSAQCAEAMARGICARSGAACGIAVTGIAGPGGATPGKPVGTVYIAVAVRDAVEARRFWFHGDRASVKWQSSVMALDMLRRKLEQL
ncbi:MAG TPA: nicotinamide-nucleotide amidohydrolase family protein, partial [Terriglobales bacterium]|nr:nicotinamide-nucleotide amidohydrolase family protein [Terriglobales bacterium]